MTTENFQSPPKFQLIKDSLTLKLFNLLENFGKDSAIASTIGFPGGCILERSTEFIISLTL